MRHSLRRLLERIPGHSSSQLTDEEVTALLKAVGDSPTGLTDREGQLIKVAASLSDAELRSILVALASQRTAK